MDRFAQTLRALLAERDISQAALARQLGLSPQAVSAWLTGGTLPSPDNVARVEHALDVQPRGSLVRLAGYHTDGDTDEPTVESLIRSDPGLSAEDKRVLLRVVALARDRFAREQWVDEEFRRRPGRRAATARRPAS